MDVAYNLNNLAAVRQALGDSAEAAAMYRRALDIKRELPGAAHPDTALTECNYAALLLDIGRQDDARTLAVHALASLEAALDPPHPQVAAALEILGRCRSI